MDFEHLAFNSDKKRSRYSVVSFLGCFIQARNFQFGVSLGFTNKVIAFKKRFDFLKT